MALSCGRFFRFFRALFAPAAAIVGFSCLLTFVFILYQPTTGPGVSQRLGWQSWDAVTEQQPGDSGSTPQDGSSTVWWNVTIPGEDGSSYPTDAWMPLWPHDTGRACRHLSYHPLTLILLPSIRDCDHQVFRSTWARRGHVYARDECRTGRYQGEMGPCRSGPEQGVGGVDVGETLSGLCLRRADVRVRIYTIDERDVSISP